MKNVTSKKTSLRVRVVLCFSFLMIFFITQWKDLNLDLSSKFGADKIILIRILYTDVNTLVSVHGVRIIVSSVVDPEPHGSR